MNRLPALIAGFIFLPILASADELAAGLETCRSVGSDAQRLACYDALATKAAPPAAAAAVAPAAVAASEPAASAAIPAPAAAASSAPPAVAAAATDDDVIVVSRKELEEQFGMRVADDEKIEPTEIRSRYKGEFRGWSGNTLFELENGQVWRQTDQKTYYEPMDSPMIVITKNAFGGYALRVEGKNPKTRVKRVK